MAKKQFPFLEALFSGAQDVKVAWAFDEQQADPVHHEWTWKKAKKELDELLKKDLLTCSYNELLEIVQTAEDRLKHLKKNPRD